MSIRRRALVITVPIAAAIGVWIYVHARAVEKIFGGRRGVEIVAHPDMVQAYRLSRLPLNDRQDAKVADYPRIAGPVGLSKKAAKQASIALLSSGTYGWWHRKDCWPTYGVLLSFTQGGDRVDVLFCFECDMLLVGLNGETVGGEDFDFGRNVFVRAAKECFPDDEEIQQLEER